MKDALERARRAVAELDRSPDWVKVVHALEATLAHSDATARALRADTEREEEDAAPASEIKAGESQRFWACALEDAVVHRMGLPSRAAALAALEGQAGEVICYERGFPGDVAAELFDVDNLLSRAEELALADRRVLDQFDYGLFDGLDEGDLRRRLGQAFVDWVKDGEGRILAVVDREEVEVADAEDAIS